MNDLGILFLHHRNDAVTREHFRLAQEANPGAVMFPLTGHPKGEGLPGSIAFASLENWDKRWWKVTDGGETIKTWANPDLAICQWFDQNTVRCKRWAVMEWDTCCRMSWREFWGDCWDAPAAAIKLVTPENWPDWPWYPQIAKMPEKYRASAVGMYLFGALLFTDDVLGGISRELRDNHFEAFSELRIGTLCRYLTEPRTPTNYIGKIHHFSNEVINCKTTQPGIWHPVKNLPTVIDHPELGKITVSGLGITARILPVETKRRLS